VSGAPAGVPEKRTARRPGRQHRRRGGAGIGLAMGAGMSILIAAGFVATVLAVAIAIVSLVGRSSRRGAAVVAAAIAAWLALTAALASSGVLDFGDGPPRPLALPWIAMIVAVVALRTRGGRAFRTATPPRAIVALQSFRIPVELVLWGLFVGGAMPEAMTFEGRNFDAFIGITALPVALLVGRRWFVVWHLVGLALLVNVAVVAIRAQPAIIPTVPYIWLPGFLVPVAVLSHVVGLWQAISASRVR
jgi:hypothetical protein